MRLLLAATFFVFGLGNGLAEQTFNTVNGGRTETGASTGSPSFIDIDSASHTDPSHADPSQNAAAPENPPAEEMPHLDAVALPLEPVNPDVISRRNSINDLCQALFTAAQDNGLPVQFFANLIWQESGLHNNTVSRAGALGIAQFMPATAKENGLDDPFDPQQAIPASAKLLQQLRGQFGNLGFAAAAYNAGPRRVSDWLASGHTLPRETLDYVVRVTGRSAEQWRTAPPPEGTLTFRQELPCRALPAFASLEKSQAQEAQQVANAAPPRPVPAIASNDQKAKAAPQPKLAVAVTHRVVRNDDALTKVTTKYLTIARDEPGERHGKHERRVARDNAKGERRLARDNAKGERRLARDNAKGERGRRLADARESRSRLSSRSRS